MHMQYNLKGTGIDLTTEIKSYVDAKLGGLDTLLGHSAARADVELEYLRNEEKTYRAEVMLHGDTVVRAEARGHTLHEAIDKAAGELFSELTRQKKKKVRTLRHSAARVKEYLRGWRSKL
jgi:ribosomal subunit interface protein